MDLASALHALATDASAAAQTALYSALADARLQVGMDDDAVLVERLPDGRPAALVFSGDTARRRFAPALDHVELAARDAFAGILLGGVEAVVVDPGGPVRVELGSWELRRLAAGELPDPEAPTDQERRTLRAARRASSS